MPISGLEARSVVDAAERRAAELRVRISIAVVDEGGQLILLSRMDGAPPISLRVADSKATSAALLHRDGGGIAEMYEREPGAFAALSQLAGRSLFPALGSLVIKHGDTILGAVGVSGASEADDLDCAQAALATLAVGDQLSRGAVADSSSS